jgi:hypothetical protein
MERARDTTHDNQRASGNTRVVEDRDELNDSLRQQHAGAASGDRQMRTERPDEKHDHDQRPSADDGVGALSAHQPDGQH